MTKSQQRQSKMPLIAALVIGLAGGVLISNYTILGKDLDFRAERTDASKERKGDSLLGCADGSHLPA